MSEPFCGSTTGNCVNHLVCQTNGSCMYLNKVQEDIPIVQYRIRRGRKCALCLNENKEHCFHCPRCNQFKCAEHCYDNKNGEWRHEIESGKEPPRIRVDSNGVGLWADYYCRHCGHLGISQVAIYPPEWS